MKQETPIIQQLAPTLAAALNGPFAAVAQRYIRDHLAPDSHATGTSPEDAIRTLLGDAGNLSALKALDQPFRFGGASGQVIYLQSRLGRSAT